jgi:hypothetical protein
MTNKEADRRGNMVSRVCVIFPDGAIEVISVEQGPKQAENDAREMVRLWNDDEKNPDKMAQFGTIDINLMSFKEMR